MWDSTQALCFMAGDDPIFTIGEAPRALRDHADKAVAPAPDRRERR
jgi:hypothetical protein